MKTIGVIGAGSFGKALAYAAGKNVQQVRLLFRSEEKALNFNQSAFSEKKNILGYGSLSSFFEEPLSFLIWAIPSAQTLSLAQKIQPFLTGHEVLVHTSKGLLNDQPVSGILMQELGLKHIGYLGGGCIAQEILHDQLTAGVIASFSSRVCQLSSLVLSSSCFALYESDDLIGAQWAGVYKNVLALGRAALLGAGVAQNAQAFFLTAGLKEMADLLEKHEGKAFTAYGLAGMADLLATSLSVHSRNYRFGFALGQKKEPQQILSEIGETVEGVLAAKSLSAIGRKKGMLPLAIAIQDLIEKKGSIESVLKVALQVLS